VPLDARRAAHRQELIPGWSTGGKGVLAPYFGTVDNRIAISVHVLHSRLIALLLVAAAGVWAPGCARRNDVARQPVVMRIGIGIPLLQNPTSGPRSVISSLRTEPWLTGKPDGRQAERIATSWTWDETGTVLRLKLRSDVYFQDGTRLTPELAAEALRKSVANATAEGALSFTSITSVTPSGKDSIDIKLS